jgi:hypothetical protein
MVIIAPDASEMARTMAARTRRPRDAVLCHGRRLSAESVLKAALDNKIETIQSVLRHFLEEIGGAGLGKS